MSNDGWQEKYNDLGKPTVRYPGGTVSNYLDLSTGWSEYWVNSNTKDTGRVESHNSGMTRNGKADGTKVEEYAEFLVETGANSTWSMNLTTMTDAETRLVLQKVKNAGAFVKYFELGNELYFSQYKSALPSHTDYFTVAKSRAEVIKEFFPDTKIGILCPSHIWSKEVFLPGGGSTGNREKDWYSYMLEIKNETWYDALVIHMYMSNGINDGANTIEKSYTNCIAHTDGKADEVYERLNTEFTGKEVWVTEYNVGGFSGPVPIRGTYLAGLSTANFMAKMFKHQNVSMSSWHSLVQMILFNDPAGQSLLPNDYSFSTDLQYEFFKFFKDPILNSDQYKPLTITGNGEYTGSGDYPNQYKDMDGLTFHNSTTNKGYIILFNKKDVTYQFGKNALQNTIDGEVVAVRELTPDKNLSIDEAIKSSSNKTLGEITSTAGKYALRPYSMYMLSLIHI